MTLRLSLGFIVIITLRLKLHLHINEFDTLAQPNLGIKCQLTFI